MCPILALMMPLCSSQWGFGLEIILINIDVPFIHLTFVTAESCMTLQRPCVPLSWMRCWTSPWLRREWETSTTLCCDPCKQLNHLTCPVWSGSCCRTCLQVLPIRWVTGALPCVARFLLQNLTSGVAYQVSYWSPSLCRQVPTAESAVRCCLSGDLLEPFPVLSGFCCRTCSQVLPVRWVIGALPCVVRFLLQNLLSGVAYQAS